MATRLYLKVTATSTPISPTPDSAWEDTSSFARLMISPVAGSDPMTTVSFTDIDDTPKDILFRQYISNPLTVGQTITGGQNLKAQIRGSEDNTKNNMFVTFGIRVINGTTVQKTIRNISWSDNIELALTTLTNRQVVTTGAGTNYITVAGDRLVIEVGTTGDPANGETHNSSLRFGDAALTDLIEDDLSTLDLRPWIELTDTLTFVSVITVVVGQVTETNVAQAVSVNPRRRLIGQITEIDLAQAVARIKTKMVNQALETDLAQTIKSNPIRRLINLVIETDLTQAITKLKTKLIGQINEIDLAQNVTRVKTKLINQALETDLAQVLSSRKTITVEQVLEADLAQAITQNPKRRLINQAIESDLAQAIIRIKIRLVGQITETDLAQAINKIKTKLIGQTIEIDLSQGVTSRKTKLIGQVIEVDLAQSITIVKIKLIDQVFEIDLAQFVAWAPKRRLINQVLEIDLAQLITVVTGVSIMPIGTVPVRYVIGETKNVVPVETVLISGIGIVPVREFVGPANVVPVRETNIEVPRVLVKKV